MTPQASKTTTTNTTKHSREHTTTTTTKTTHNNNTTTITKHATMTTTSSSRCSDDANIKLNTNTTHYTHIHPHPTKPIPTPTPTPTPRPHSILTSLLVALVVVVGVVGPVEGGYMDYSAPEEIQYGTCAQPKEKQPFDFRQFNGLWYQVEMVPNSYMEPKKCITLHFDWNGEEYNVTTKGLNEYDEEVQQEAVISQVVPKDPATRRYLKIHASGVPPVPYHVVKTDYHHYACVYSCFELFSLMFEAFSVLSRHAEVDHTTHHACHQAFAALEIDLTRLMPVYQGGLCLEEGLEGSGREPPRGDDEEDEEEDALAALTREEVKPSEAPNGASNTASNPTLEEELEGGMLMEEILEETVVEEEEEVEEEEVAHVGKTIDVGEEQGEGEVRGSGLRNEAPVHSSSSFSSSSTSSSSSSSSSNRTLNNSDQKRPKKGQRRKKMKGEGRKGGREEEVGKEEEASPAMTSRDEQLYLDKQHLDSLYYPEAKRRGEGGRGRGGRGDEGDEASLPSCVDPSPYSGGGGVAASTPLQLLLALFALALCARQLSIS